MDAEQAAKDVYSRLIRGWNGRDADAMAAAIAADGLVIGFDGSQMTGPGKVAAELARVFADHETATYVTKIRSVKALADDAALLHAVAGMVPPGASDLMPDRNAIQTLVARRVGDSWAAALFQTTPARFDGRPELAAALTAELAALVTR